MSLDKVLGRERTKHSVSSWLHQRKYNQRNKHRRQFGAWVPATSSESEVAENLSPAETKKKAVAHYLQVLLHRQDVSREEVMAGWSSSLAANRAKAEKHELLSRIDMKKAKQREVRERERERERETVHIYFIVCVWSSDAFKFHLSFLFSLTTTTTTVTINNKHQQ